MFEKSKQRIMHKFISSKSPRILPKHLSIETVISDFNKLVATELQMFHKNQKPKLFNYKTFKEQSFRNELDKELAKPGLSSDVLAEFAVNFHQG